MAVMIPETPRDFDPYSMEDRIFEALAQLHGELCMGLLRGY